MTINAKVMLNVQFRDNPATRNLAGQIGIKWIESAAGVLTGPQPERR